MDKAGCNIAIISKKLYVKHLNELESTSTYEKVNSTQVKDLKWKLMKRIVIYLIYT